MLHHITINDGMLCVDGGVSLSGVTIDMVTNLRGIFVVLSELCEALNASDNLSEEVQMKLHEANSLLEYLRTTRRLEQKNGQVSN